MRTDPSKISRRDVLKRGAAALAGAGALQGMLAPLADAMTNKRNENRASIGKKTSKSPAARKNKKQPVVVHPKTPAPTALTPATPVDTAALSRLIEELLHVSGTPGLSIAVIEERRVTWAQGFGIANAATHAPVTPATVFQAASLTKPTFAYAALKLCETGALALDAPLRNSYFPQLQPSPDPLADAITARMALAHTSGLPLRHSASWPMKLDFPPGQRFGYSGAAYLYLQQIIEHATGQPLDHLMQQYVTGPLNLAHSSYVWKPEYETACAVGYDWDGAPVNDVSRPAAANAAGSLHTTPADFAVFLLESMNTARRDHALLDYLSRRMLLSPQVRLRDELAWGIGWGLRLTEKDDRLWHLGDSRGYASYAAASCKTGRGLVVFTNSRHGMRICHTLAESVLGDEGPTFAWIYDSFYNGAPKPWPNEKI